ncbi:uncharacterized protein LOC133195150 [Saccostrea echinata]|uniref:uncharacterized protein LOC133195150 n=1 Tax=Saccostrea echinata TaxID=191078 RepID=UPI002A7ED03A|nr:uncharacterized protein LOC133195150 [Saccostrea echinata]
MRGSIVLCKVFLLVTALDKGRNENVTSSCNPYVSLNNPFPEEGDRVVIKAHICSQNKNNIIHWRKCKNLVGTCVAESCTADNLVNNATALQSFFIIEKARKAKDSCFVKFETYGLKLNQSVIIYKHPEFISVIADGKNDTDILLKNKEKIVLEVKASCMFPLPMITVLHKDDNDESIFHLLKAEPGTTVSDDECNVLEYSTSSRLEIPVADIFENSHKGLYLVKIHYGDRIVQHLINVTLDGVQSKIPMPVHFVIAMAVFGSLIELFKKTDYHRKIWNAIKRFVSHATTLVLSTIPSQPSNIFAEVTGPNTIDVSWNPPKQIENGVRKYFICFNGNYLKQEKREEFKGTGTKYQLQELKPNTMYTIKVALSTQGVETDVGIIKAKTQPSKPSAAPENVCGKPYRDSRKIKVTWNPPPKDQQNGKIEGYKIFYAEYIPNRTNQFTKEKSVDAEKQEEVLSILSSSTEYEISVLAFNCKGEGPKSSPIRIRTVEDGSILDPEATILHFFPYFLAFPIIVIDFKAITQSTTYLTYIMRSMCVVVLIHGIIDGVFNYKKVITFHSCTLKYIRSFRKKTQIDEEATEPSIQNSPRRNQRDKKATDEETEETTEPLIQSSSRRRNQRDEEATNEEATEPSIQNPSVEVGLTCLYSRI